MWIRSLLFLVLTILLASGSTAQTNQRKNLAFDLFGATQFTFGMSEQEVFAILKAKKKNYTFADSTRRNSVVTVRDFAYDKRVLLDGPISAIFLFSRPGLFAAERVLGSIKLCWMNWTETEDREDGAKELAKQLSLLLGKPVHFTIVFNQPIWDFHGNTLTISNDPLIHVVYEPEQQVEGGKILYNDGETPPPDDVPVDKDAVPIKQVPPQYPELAARAGLEGIVWVKIWVDKEGKAKKAVVMRSDADILNMAATDAAMQWRFTPAIWKNKPVEVWVSIPFRFRLPKK